MYFKPTELAIRKKYFTVVLLFITVGYGFVSYRALPKEWTPDIQIPILYAVIPYPGSSAEDVENIITYKMEKEMKGMDQMEKITSSSRQGVSSISAEFTIGFDIEKAKDQVRTAWDNIQGELPDEVENMTLIEVNLSEAPILTFLLSGDMPLFEMKKVAEKMKDDIEAIKGVIEAEVNGGLEREIQVEVDPFLLEYYKINLNQIAQAISQANANIPGGDLDLDSANFLISVPGQISKAEEIENFLVTSREGVPIYVKNLARVIDGFKEIESVTRVLNENAISVDVKKKAGENLLDIIASTKQIIAEYEAVHPALDFAVTLDASNEVTSQLSQLQNNILLGFILVFTVLCLFMGPLTALIVGIAVPISILISYICLRAIGVSVNMVVLFALILSLGMMVDNGIVVVENIFRHLKSGKKITEACLVGVTEIAGAVITSTLTTLSAFFPLLFHAGYHRRFHEVPADYPDRHPVFVPVRRFHLQRSLRPYPVAHPQFVLRTGTPDFRRGTGEPVIFAENLRQIADFPDQTEVPRSGPFRGGLDRLLHDLFR